MLNEEFADRSLEKVMAMAEDDILKSSDEEDKKEAYERYVSLQKIFNDRLKIQDDYSIAESRAVMESEKFDYEKENGAYAVELEDKRARRDAIMQAGITAAKFGLVGLEIAFQGIMIHNNLIESDAVSKSATKGILGTISNYLRV